jgi:hypothetical protein
MRAVQKLFEQRTAQASGFGLTWRRSDGLGYFIAI